MLRKETKLAAETFARSGLPFEEVALKLISSMKISATKEDKSQPISSAFCLSSEPEDYDSLRIYMLELLKVLPTSAKSQRTMLATWITEIYLHSIYASNYVDDQKADVTNQLKAFLRTNRYINLTLFLVYVLVQSF